MIYFVSRRRKRSPSIIEAMQLKKSIESTVPPIEMPSSKQNDNDQPYPINKGGDDMRMDGFVNEEIIIEGGNKETELEIKGNGACVNGIGDHEFIIETKGNDVAFEGELNDN